MTLNQRIIDALSPLGLPVVPDTDTGSRERCFVFSADQAPTFFCDDVPWIYNFQVQVHLFLPAGENGVALTQQAARALHGAGFTRPEVLDASDGSGQHKVLECETQALEEEGEYRWL